MTVKELIEELKTYHQDDWVVIEVDPEEEIDEDLYDFYVDPIQVNSKHTEVRLCMKKTNID